MRNVGIEYPAARTMAFCDLGDPPAPGPTEILLRTHYSGITNGTERHALLGEHGWDRYPSRNGYQHVCTVEAAGDRVKGLAPGDWVYFGRFVGHRGWHVQDVSNGDPHSIGSHLCIPLPEDVDRSRCALLGVAGVGVRAAHRSRVGEGQNVWVAGVGPIGQFVAQAARVLGARVTVTDVNAHRLDVARELGAHRVLNVNEAAGEAALLEGRPYDRIFDCCGLDMFLVDVHEKRLLANGGVVNMVAVRTDTTLRWPLLHATEASIEVSCHYSIDDVRFLLEHVRRGAIRIEPLVSHTVPIDDAPSVYATLRDRPQNLLGVIFDWSL